jgi:hypothetical protein
MLQVMRYTLQLAWCFCRLNVLTAEIVTMRGDFFGYFLRSNSGKGGGGFVFLGGNYYKYREFLRTCTVCNAILCQSPFTQNISLLYGKLFSLKFTKQTLHCIIGPQIYTYGIQTVTSLNPLTPNGLYSGRAVSPLNSRMAII